MLLGNGHSGTYELHQGASGNAIRSYGLLMIYDEQSQCHFRSIIIELEALMIKVGGNYRGGSKQLLPAVPTQLSMSLYNKKVSNLEVVL